MFYLSHFATLLKKSFQKNMYLPTIRLYRSEILPLCLKHIFVLKKKKYNIITISSVVMKGIS